MIWLSSGFPGAFYDKGQKFEVGTWKNIPQFTNTKLKKS